MTSPFDADSASSASHRRNIVRWIGLVPCSLGAGLAGYGLTVGIGFLYAWRNDVSVTSPIAIVVIKGIAQAMLGAGMIYGGSRCAPSGQRIVIYAVCAVTIFMVGAATVASLMLGPARHWQGPGEMLMTAIGAIVMARREMRRYPTSEDAPTSPSAPAS